MVTNTYLPHTGGVARSVYRFSRAYEEAGHKVTVVYPGLRGEEVPVSPRTVRLPAVKTNTGFYVHQKSHMQTLRTAFCFDPPDVVHSHHPYLLGVRAKALARAFEVPLVFTHHTMYEDFAHVLGPWAGIATREGLKELATVYANGADVVVAPSASTKAIIKSRGVRRPVRVVPTGVDLAEFQQGDPAAFRRRLGIPADAPVFGHVGRLSQEKNLPFLLEAVERVLKAVPQAHFVVTGSGPVHCGPPRGLEQRWHQTGALGGPNLSEAFAAMDVFLFASKADTQGMVLAEAMVSGTPVVALNAPGARDIINKNNGVLVKREGVGVFARAAIAAWRDRARLSPGATATAKRYSMARTARAALEVYSEVEHRPRAQRALEFWGHL